MRGKPMILLVLILIVVPMAISEITINPQKYEIRDIEFNKTYNIIITVINPDSRAYDMQVMTSKDSFYLHGNIHIEPVIFSIGPNEKKNIQLSLTVPITLSPEEHILFLDFFSENHQLGIFKLSFIVPGDRIEKIEMDDVTLDRQPGDGLLYFEFRMKNTGTVIARGSPVIEISKDDETIERFGDESRIIILPGNGYNLSLMYDTTHLSEGDYEFKAKFLYNDLETDYSRGEFSVSEAGKSTEVEKKDIYEGEKLTITQTILNPEEKLSFYSIDYYIEDEDIVDIIEGEVQARVKEISIEIDTSELSEGTYGLDINIRSGQRLENSETRKIQFTIKSKKIYYLQGFILLIAGISCIGIILYLMKPNAAKKPGFSRAPLEPEISRLTEKFNDIEITMKQFTQEINKFITESNQWLESQGYGNYGFR